MIKLVKAKTYSFSLALSVTLCLIVGMLIYYSVTTILLHNNEDSLKEIAKQGAITVEKEIVGYSNILETLAIMEEIKDPQNPMENKLDLLRAEVVKNRHYRMSLFDAQGWGNTTDGVRLNVADREYFKKALSGRSTVSDPLTSMINGERVVVFATPVFYNGHVVSVLTSTHEVSILSKITDNIRLGKHGSSFMINSQGDTIAHSDRKLVYSRDNDFKNVRNDPSLKPLVRLERMMTRGKTGAGEYTYHGVKKYMAFAPIKGTGWSLAVTAPKKQVFANLNQVFTFLGLLMFSFFIPSVVMSIYNIYLHQHLTKAMTTSETAIETANIIIIGFDLAGVIHSFNRYAELKLGYSEDEIVGVKNINDFIPAVHQSDFQELLRNIKSQKTIHNFELPLQHHDHSLIYILWNVNWVKNELHDPDHVEIMGIDISGRVKAEKELLSNHEELTALYQQLASSNEELRDQYEQLSTTQEKLTMSEERFRLAQEGSNDVIWDWDIPNKTIYVSNKITTLLGYKPEETTDTLLQRITHPDDLDKTLKTFRSHLRGETPELAVELRLKTKEGPYKWIFVRGKTVKDSAGNSARMAGSLTDISDRKAKEQHIHQLAYYDSLSGLPNRTWLYENIAERIANTRALERKGALIFIDIDNFKLINDTFGHIFGDRILSEIGKRLTAAAGEGNIVSRLSGDEFVVIIAAEPGKETIAEFADQIMAAFDAPYQMDGNNFFITASAGIAIFPDCGETLEELLKNADLAMYHAKEEGKRHYVHYDKSMKEALLEKTQLEDRLRSALNHDEFVLVFQPLVSITGKINGYEALIRWESPKFGIVSPVKFIKAAEENGLIVPIGQWVLKNAAVFASKIMQTDPSLYVSVNISVIQLMQNNFVEVISNAVEEYSLPPQNLNLEITESLLMESLEENIEKLERLKQMGFGISLDDFGTGYSSLNYLKRLPIETVKIDKSFVQDIQSNETEKNLIASIISLAHLLGLKVVAEGVETEGQFEFLARSHCDLIQGYLISKPLKSAEALLFLENRRDPESGPKAGTRSDV